MRKEGGKEGGKKRGGSIATRLISMLIVSIAGVRHHMHMIVKFTKYQCHNIVVLYVCMTLNNQVMLR